MLRHSDLSWYRSEDLSKKPRGRMTFAATGLMVIAGWRSDKLTIVADRELPITGDSRLVKKLKHAAEELVRVHGRVAPSIQLRLSSKLVHQRGDAESLMIPATRRSTSLEEDS